MKKKLCIVLAVLLFLGLGLWWAYEYATDLLVKKTLMIVSQDPDIRSDFEAAVDKALADRNGAQAKQEGDKGTESEAPSEAPSNTSQPTKTEPPTVSTDDGTLSIDDLQPSDKKYVMSIYKRFTAAEVNQVSSMLSNGITPEEKKTIKAIVYAKVSREELNTLFAIAKKYQ